jgi:plasmid rolling circle replication initiator protein Rep
MSGQERGWKRYKDATKTVAEAYALLHDESKAYSVFNCSIWHLFNTYPLSHEHDKRLKYARLYRNRLCPTFAWRKSLKN